MIDIMENRKTARPEDGGGEQSRGKGARGKKKAKGNGENYRVNWRRVVEVKKNWTEWERGEDTETRQRYT